MKKFCTYLLAATLTCAAGAVSAFAQAGGAMGMSTPAAAFDYKAQFLNDMKDLQTKFVGLAQAIPQDKYTWRPGEGVRSNAEVFLHVAGGNFSLPGMMGAKPADGYKRQGYETSTTDKAAIIEQLNKSFDYIDSTVAAMSADDLSQPHKGFGGASTTGYGILFLITTDLHEHLGQEIAYARMNNVVPPWTAERQAARGNAGGGAMRGPGAAPSPKPSN
jgi:uncharacterized damage-inducible protein DinB